MRLDTFHGEERTKALTQLRDTAAHVPGLCVRIHRRVNPPWPDSEGCWQSVVGYGWLGREWRRQYLLMTKELKPEMVSVTCSHCARTVRVSAEHVRTPYYCC